MKRRAVKPRGLAIAAFAASVFVCSTPASAIPGQTLPAFRSWAARHTILRGISRTTDELSGRPAFDLLTSDHGIVWHYHAHTNGSTVTTEWLAVSEGAARPGSIPIRQDGTGYGVTFLRSLYGNAIVSDFLSSRMLGSIVDSQSHVVTTFYRGSRFGYETSAGILVIATPSAMANDLATLARCAGNSTSCRE